MRISPCVLEKDIVRQSVSSAQSLTNMSSLIETEETIRVGEATTITSSSPSTEYQVVFEDDCETGYFYGLDKTRADEPILEALHVYNVSNVVDKDKPSLVQIIWSEDGFKAALLINEFPHAVFDFAAKRAYCRTNFPNLPSSDPDWSTHPKEWNDAAMDLFR